LASLPALTTSTFAFP
jgi:hypothetical protein